MEPTLVRDLNPQAPDPISASELVTESEIEDYLKPIRAKLDEYARRIDISQAKAEAAHEVIKPRPNLETGDTPRRWEEWPDEWKAGGKFTFIASRDADFEVEGEKVIIRKGAYHEVPFKVWDEIMSQGLI